VIVQAGIGTFDVNIFVANMSAVLNIPAAAIIEVEVAVDQSTSSQTYLTFKLQSVGCIDPIAKALELKRLAEARDPVLSAHGFSGLVVVSVENQADEAVSCAASLRPWHF
jgi:hypothetical protein